MANQIFVDPFPLGKSIESGVQVFRGAIALAGSAVSTGEPLNWASLISGEVYNQVSLTGNGVHGSNQAYVTTLAASTGTITATANNNFQVGELLTFVACTSTLGLLLNGVIVQVVTASATQFTFLSASTGTGTGELGMAVSANQQVFPLQRATNTLSVTVSALSASGSTLTVTGANFFVAGAQVVVAVATGTLGPKLAGLTLPVLASTGTAFTATMPSALTGSTGTGTASGNNPPQPSSVKVWSELGSGYIYQFSRTTGVLYVLEVGAIASTPATAVALAPLAAAAYPSGVLADLVRYEATFMKA